MNTAKSPVHNQGSTPPFCPSPAPRPKKCENLGKVATYESRDKQLLPLDLTHLAPVV